ncbi:MAG: RNA polymerase sigma factor RpoE [Chloroflexota bacterium]
MERAPSGDVDAYAALVGRHQAHAIGLAAVVLGGQGDAEDVAQEAFIKAYYALGTFKAGASFHAWFAQIVTNEARNWRASANRRAVLGRRLQERGWSAVLAPSAEQVALNNEQHDSMLIAVDQLRVQDREILAYRYLLDLSEAEIAKALRCAPGTVKSRLSRARGRLREDLTRVNPVSVLTPESRHVLAQHLPGFTTPASTGTRRYVRHTARDASQTWDA